jgi:hypothetical protein
MRREQRVSRLRLRSLLRMITARDGEWKRQSTTAAERSSTALVAAEAENREGVLGPLPHRNRENQARRRNTRGHDSAVPRVSGVCKRPPSVPFATCSAKKT